MLHEQCTKGQLMGMEMIVAGSEALLRKLRSVPPMPGVKQGDVSIEELEEMCAGKPHLEEMLARLIDQVLQYTEAIVRYHEVVSSGAMTSHRDDFIAIRNLRVLSHDTTMDMINAFSRSLRAEGVDNKWLQPFMSQNRAGYATFAIKLAFSVANSRVGKESR